jgi:chorismate mutase
MDEFGFLPGRSGSIERVRKAIDAADLELVAVVGRRIELCRRVAAVKRETGRAIRDEAREAIVRARFVEALGPETLSSSALHLADALIRLGLEAEGWVDEE